MIVVSDTSPFINLAALDRLTLLRDLYDRILVPQAVSDEIIASAVLRPGDTEVGDLGWAGTRQVSHHVLAASLRLELDEGEAEAIALAIELKADLLLLDERKGRMIASRLGLRVTGLLGLLMEAKQGGLIAEVKPLMDSLIVKAGFWISQVLYDRVLKVAGE